MRMNKRRRRMRRKNYGRGKRRHKTEDHNKSEGGKHPPGIFQTKRERNFTTPGEALTTEIYSDKLWKLGR